MTARRRARAAAPSGASAVIEGVPVPLELLDAGHPVWHDTARYRAFMGARAWCMPASERLGVAASAGNRRRAAAVGWAREHGLDRGWPQLAAWGLAGNSEAPTISP